MGPAITTNAGFVSLRGKCPYRVVLCASVFSDSRWSFLAPRVTGRSCRDGASSTVHCSLVLLALESDQVDDVQIDGKQRVVDRGGQITLIPPLRAKQFVQADQQTNVEDIEADVSTDCHWLHQHPLRFPQ